MNYWKLRLSAGGLAAAVVLTLVTLAPSSVSAHEPVFGLGPHTLYEGGFSSSLSTAHASAPGDAEGTTVGSVGMTYGLTANFNLSAGLPFVIDRPTEDGHSAGISDPVLQVKWRPLASFSKRNVDALSLIGAVQLPAGQDEFSNGNTGYVLGATAARENLRYYLFWSVRYSTQTAGLEGKPGDVFMYDAATGIRPFILEYDQPDLVILVEFNGRTSRDAQGSPEQEHHAQTLTQRLEREEEPSNYRTRRQSHTGGATAVVSGTGEGGTEFAVTPELLFSWGQVMLKSGIQIPFWDNFSDEQPIPDYRLKTDLIVQF